MKFYYANKALYDKVLISLCFFLAIFIFVRFVLLIAWPFVLGYLLALVLSPLAGLISNKLKIGRAFGSGFAIFLLILFFWFIGFNIFKAFFAQAKALFLELPQYIDSLPFDIKGAGSSLIPFVVKIPNMFAGILVSLISSFFLIIDIEKINNWLKGLFFNSEKAAALKRRLHKTVLGYFVAQLKLISFTFTICFSGLLILKYPYALFMSVLIAIIDGLPLFGSGFILWPWAGYTFFQGDYQMGLYLLIIYACAFLTRQFLEPKILGKQIELHPLLTLMSVYIGLKLLGPLGLAFGPFGVVVLKEILNDEDTNE